ncbi:MAG: TolC family outer membrane protein [Novosphingobium sp.]
MISRGTFRGATAVLAAASLIAGPALGDTLKLDQAVRQGLAQSPELGQAQARIGQAEAGRDQARRQWLPNVDVTGAAGLRHLENDARVQLGLSSIDEKPLYATIGLDQPLWDFGRRGNSVKVQNARLASAQWDEQQASESVTYAIARAYLQVVVQLSILEAAKENLAFHTDLAADVSEGVDKGAMSISEKQQATERLESARINLVQANADLATANAELALLIGIAQVDVTTPPDPSRIVPPSLEEAIAVAEVNDPRVRSAEEKLRAAGFNASKARSEYWPQIGLQGSIRAGKDFEGYRGTTRDYEGLVVMRWNIFNGGITAAKVREADRGSDEARFGLAQAQRDSELGVRKAWIGLENWRAKSAIQQERLNVARGVRESYRAQFGIGRRSLLDLLDAQNSVYNATVESQVANTGLLLAQYGLLAQMGRLRSFLGVEKPVIDPTMYGPK